MKLSPRFWYGLVAVGVCAEAYALRSEQHNGTASHAWRTACRTDHPLGRAALVVGWGVLSAWLIPHLLRNPERLISG